MNLKLAMAITLATTFITFGCDGEFTGDGSGGIGKRFNGAAGNGDGNTPDVGENGDGIGNGNGSNGGIGDGTGANGGLDGIDGGNLPGGSLGGGGGVDTRNYSPMTVRVHRRDSSGSNKHDHSHITLAYQVIGGRQVESGTIGNQGDTFTIARACPPSGTVNAVIQFQLGTGARISPNKNTNVGGPIGYRRGPSSILVGFEKEGVNNPQETAYHNNDDLVMEFICGTGAQLIVNNLCLDQRIPDNGWDLVSDNDTHDGDALGRVCNGI